MAGTRRHPDLVCALEARARTMRAEGYRMADISRAIGVPTPTLYQWAARGEWRQGDLAGPVVMVPVEPELFDPEAGAPNDEDGEPPTALEAAQAVLGLAARAGSRGQLARADQAAKLARQLFLLAEQAQRVAAAEAALHPKPVQLSDAEVEALRDSLRERLFPKDPVRPRNDLPLVEPAAKPAAPTQVPPRHRAAPTASIRQL